MGEAADGLQAVPQAVASKPGVVILDYMMLGQRGDKTASILRKLLPSLRIVAFSALDGRPDWADAWLPKQDIGRVLQFVKRLAGTEETAAKK